MNSISSDELDLQRLLERTKKLARLDLIANGWKISAATTYLDDLLGRLQKDSTIDKVILRGYGQAVDDLKSLVQSGQQKQPEEQLRFLDKIPNRFDNVVGARNTFPTNSTTKDESELFESTSGIRVRNRVVYKADLRKELLESSRQANEHDVSMSQHTETQENLAQDLLSLTRSLKQNMTLAGNVIKDDTKRLSTMNKQVETNRENLAVESDRLAKHAYRWCGFDCCVLFIFIFLFSTFICMVIFIKFFHKPANR